MQTRPRFLSNFTGQLGYFYLLLVIQKSKTDRPAECCLQGTQDFFLKKKLLKIFLSVLLQILDGYGLASFFSPICLIHKLGPA